MCKEFSRLGKLSSIMWHVSLTVIHSNSVQTGHLEFDKYKQAFNLSNHVCCVML